MTDDMGLINVLVAEMNGRHSALKTAENLYAPLLSPDFNCFNYIEPNENKLSYIISDILSPNGSHGQGSLFFKEFLKNFNIEFEIPFDEPLNQWKVEVETLTSAIEHSTRRIDITIKCTSHCIGIENKPWAVDQPKQIIEYANNLGNYFPKKWSLIYLSGYGNLPSTESISEGDRKILIAKGSLKCCGYKEELIPWLTDCEAKCRSEKFRYFLREFIGYCIDTFCGGIPMAEQNAILDSVIKSQNHLKAVFLLPTKDEIRVKLLEVFHADLAALVEADGWKLEWPADIYSEYAQFGIYKDGWEKYRIGCEFAAKNLRDLCCGVIKLEENYPDLGLNIENINMAMNQPGKEDSWWPGQYKGAFHGDWWNNVEPWLEIQSKVLPKEICATLLKLAGLVEKVINEKEGITP